MTSWRRVLGAVGVTGLVVVTAACIGLGGGLGGSTGSGNSTGESTAINLVGFAVPEGANKAVAQQWAQTGEGKGVEFVSSYGPSGDQSRAVASGLKADYVHFSVPTDVTRLVDAGLVAKDWDQGPNRGVVSTSIVVFGVPKGNPRHVKDWDDLIKPGSEVVTPNPASSGAARWNALAAWGQVVANGGTEADARAYLAKLYAKTVALPNSGRDATTAFTGGTGNVFLTYENEAILARQNDEDFDYVIPPTTLKVENPGTVIVGAAAKATDWLNYVQSADGQTQFALKGFRPIDGVTVSVDRVEGAEHPSNPFPAVEHLITVSDTFGSWSDLTKKYFAEDTGIITKIIAKSGKAQ